MGPARIARGALGRKAIAPAATPVRVLLRWASTLLVFACAVSSCLCRATLRNATGGDEFRGITSAWTTPTGELGLAIDAGFGGSWAESHAVVRIELSGLRADAECGRAGTPATLRVLELPRHALHFEAPPSSDADPVPVLRAPGATEAAQIMELGPAPGREFTVYDVFRAPDGFQFLGPVSSPIRFVVVHAPGGDDPPSRLLCELEPDGASHVGAILMLPITLPVAALFDVLLLEAALILVILPTAGP